MKLIVGLGNKGGEYDRTRHNIGFEFLDHIAGKLKCKVDKKINLAFFIEKNISGEKILLIKPRTYMNQSGEAVKHFVSKHKIVPADILVLQDDIDLPLFKVKIKKGGGAGGHNGIKSIIEYLGTREFCRVRVGVGKPEHRGQTIDYVLGKFTKEEEAQFKAKFPVVEKFVMEFILKGYEAAAGRFKDEDTIV